MLLFNRDQPKKQIFNGGIAGIIKPMGEFRGESVSPSNALGHLREDTCIWVETALSFLVSISC